MKIVKFEDIIAWKESRELVNMIYKLTSKSLFKTDFGLKEQIQKAAVSCMSNVAEGFDGQSNTQFIQYLIYTRRSSSEVQSELYVALDRSYITQEEFDRTYEQSKKVGQLANGLIRYLKTSKRATG
jgi:four helix bundle protein